MNQLPPMASRFGLGPPEWTVILVIVAVLILGMSGASGPAPGPRGSGPRQSSLRAQPPPEIFFNLRWNCGLLIFASIAASREPGLSERDGI